VVDEPSVFEKMDILKSDDFWFLFVSVAVL
jgi:hypothetical protein